MPYNAAKMAAGMGADVTIMDLNLSRLRYLDEIMPANVNTCMSSEHNIRSMIGACQRRMSITVNQCGCCVCNGVSCRVCPYHIIPPFAHPRRPAPR